MSDTPDTDAETMQDEWDHADTDFGPFEPSTTVPADFARELERERDEARADAHNYKEGYYIYSLQAESAERERDELREKYDKLATENMLEVNKICNQRDAAIDAIMKIEEIFIDGDDTYEDWKNMGQIARTFLEKNT